MSAERWRPVVGYEGYYEVSDAGRVRSLDRVVVFSGSRSMTKPGVPMRTYRNRKGYVCVRLNRDGRKRSRPVSVLVAEAWIGPKPTPDAQARHLDGDQEQNGATNIAWGTQSENELDKVRHGTATFMPQEVCERGHRLVEPNVARYGLARGEHHCLACDRARSNARDARRRGVEIDVVARSHEHYAKIMGEAA